MELLKVTHSLQIGALPIQDEEVNEVIGVLSEMSEIANVGIDSASFVPLFEETGVVAINLNFLTKDAKTAFENNLGAKKHFARYMLSKCDCDDCKEKLDKLDEIFERIEKSKAAELESSVVNEGSFVMNAPETIQ